MLALPLIRQDDNSHFSPMDKVLVGLDSMITALMMQGTINDSEASQDEVDTFRALSVATIVPAEA